MADKCTVCICGGGNGAHTFAILSAAHHHMESRVLTMFQDEAERWTKKIEEEPMTCVKKSPDGTTKEYKGKPALVTKDPAKAIPGCNVVVFIMPAFAHQAYFEAIKPHIQPNTAIIGMPGQPGFEFQCFDVLGNVARQCNIMSYDSLPWATRLTEFGRSTEILGCKYALMGSQIVGKSELKFDPMQALQSMLGELPKLSLTNNYIEPYLMTKSIVHPPLMYARWKDWDGQPMSEKPLFYQGLDQLGADSLSGISDEVVATADAIGKLKPQLKMTHVLHLFPWYQQDYKDAIKDPTSLLTTMQSNTAYNGLVHPMKEAGGGKWVPNFNYRYLEEDVPYGIVVTKGLAELANVPTPVTDKVLTWCQGKIGKEFIVGTELKGKDIKCSRAPQAYGYHSLDDLIALM